MGVQSHTTLVVCAARALGHCGRGRSTTIYPRGHHRFCPVSFFFSLYFFSFLPIVLPILPTFFFFFSSSFFLLLSFAPLNRIGRGYLPRLVHSLAELTSLVSRWHSSVPELQSVSTPLPVLLHFGLPT